MGIKRHKPEEIVTKFRQVGGEVFYSLREAQILIEQWSLS
jgi:hypothetical protein